MRTKNSVKNILIAVFCNIITIFLNFFSQKIFIEKLGIEYSGLNSVFSNIISMLSISELGIGTAIIYHLYKPISEKNISKIKSLMGLYKKAYRIIALVVLLLGLCIMPFLNLFVNSKSISDNIYLVYCIFLVDSVISYLASYKRSIIYANQKNRIIDLVHIGYTICMNVFQIFILIYLRNYLLYLIIKVVCRILENVIISIISNRIYPYLLDKDVDDVDLETKLDIKKKVKAQLFHSIGGYIVLGTDNIIISFFLGLSVAGIYGNYILIINAANTILSQIFSAITASVGDLLVEKNCDKNYMIYKKIFFVNFIIYGFASIVFYFVINDFIMIWLKNGTYIFSNYIILFLAINFFMQGMRRTMQIFATAAGICHENRYVPLLEAIINLCFSILLLKLVGISGVILGTIVSTFILHFYSFPKYIYKPLFNRRGIGYIREFLKYSFIFVLNFAILYFVNGLVLFSNIYFNFFVHLLISSIVFLFDCYICFSKTDELRFFKNVILSMFCFRKV